MSNPSTPPDLFTQMLYRDAPAGIAFLERALGFERTAVHAADDGSVAHAELRAGRGCLMTATWSEGGMYRFVIPRDIGGMSTGSVYVGAPDVETRFERAKAAGAEVVKAMTETDYGSLDFTARDGEGFLWHFGTYRPTVDGGDPYASPSADVYAGMRYADANAAIAWLEKAFGFERQAVYADGDQVAHAQLRFGSSIFMTGSARDDAYNLRTPRQLDGAYTHIVCGYTDEPDAHCARARAAGAEIMEEPADKPYGARVYVARDPEGYVWCFGTYRPALEPTRETVTSAGA
jgi:uncharacterized glyoxalase superfamily protein PhnB